MERSLGLDKNRGAKSLYSKLARLYAKVLYDLSLDAYRKIHANDRKPVSVYLGQIHAVELAELFFDGVALVGVLFVL